MENLAATNGGPFDDIINALAEKLYNEKISKGTIDQALYDQTATELIKAMNEGLGGTTFSFEDPRNSLKAYLEQNIYSFSAAKSTAELEHMRSLLYDSDKKRTFEEFRNACIDAGYQFNVNWLRTEYNTANAAVQAAAQWANFEKEGVDVLQYSTVGDDRVRPAHEALDRFTALLNDPIWRIIYPPNDWNCRCWVVPGRESDIGGKTLDMNYIKENIPAQFQKNVGTSKVIYQDGWPYFQQGGFDEKLLDAVKNYGMSPVKNIYQDFKWPSKIEFASKEEANHWWTDQAKGLRQDFFLKDITGVVVKFDNDFRVHAFEHNLENRWALIGNVPDIIQNPDEVWSLRYKDELYRYYIKYYDGYPLTVWVGADDGMRANNFLEFKKKNKIDIGEIDKKRKGILIYRKTLEPFPIPE